MDLLDDATLDAYLARIGITPSPRADLDALRALMWAHVTTVPFENLDILLGEPIRIDLPSVIAKLVTRRRGGYCFEQNALFAAVLRTLGFGVTTLAARVRIGATVPTPRSHMMLAVDVPGAGRWLADVGFGGQCITAPMPLEPGELQMHHDRYRLVETDAPRGLMLQMVGSDGAWVDEYVFTFEPQLPVDYEVSNWYTSTNPGSHFTRGPTVALTTQAGRLTYRGGEYVRRGGGDILEKEAITDGERLLAVLAGEFGLTFPPGTRFRGGPP
jgi:N-hydroxyarylamine O-acetyltransferase